MVSAQGDSWGWRGPEGDRVLQAELSQIAPCIPKQLAGQDPVSSSAPLASGAPPALCHHFSHHPVDKVQGFHTVKASALNKLSNQQNVSIWRTDYSPFL